MPLPYPWAWLYHSSNLCTNTHKPQACLPSSQTGKWLPLEPKWFGVGRQRRGSLVLFSSPTPSSEGSQGLDQCGCCPMGNTHSRATPMLCVPTSVLSARYTCIVQPSPALPKLGHSEITACSVPSTDLHDQLHHLRVHQPMHGFPVDMGDEITLTKPRLAGWTTVLHMLPQEENSPHFGA